MGEQRGEESTSGRVQDTRHPTEGTVEGGSESVPHPELKHRLARRILP